MHICGTCGILGCASCRGSTRAARAAALGLRVSTIATVARVTIAYVTLLCVAGRGAPLRKRRGLIKEDTRSAAPRGRRCARAAAALEERAAALKGE